MCLTLDWGNWKALVCSSDSVKSSGQGQEQWVCEPCSGQRRQALLPRPAAASVSRCSVARCVTPCSRPCCYGHCNERKNGLRRLSMVWGFPSHGLPFKSITRWRSCQCCGELLSCLSRQIRSLYCTRLLENSRAHLMLLFLLRKMQPSNLLRMVLQTWSSFCSKILCNKPHQNQCIALKYSPFHLSEDVQHCSHALSLIRL